MRAADESRGPALARLTGASRLTDDATGAPRRAAAPSTSPFAPVTVLPVARPARRPAPVRAGVCAVHAILAAGLAACGDRAAPADSARAAAGTVPPAIVEAPAGAYRVVAVPNPGAVRASVRFTGDAPADTLVRPAADATGVCGASLTDATIERAGDRLGGVVVWLPDVRAGRALPVDRRFELTNARCRLEPRVQVVLAGGTLNVRSLDQLAHRTRLVRYGAAGGMVSTIATTEGGAVVPDDAVLARPGQIEATCEAHPWSRAWLFVFDHPYAAVTARDGSVRLDGVPPGRWRILAWHERFGLREDSVTVGAGQEAGVEMVLKGTRDQGLGTGSGD